MKTLFDIELPNPYLQGEGKDMDKKKFTDSLEELKKEQLTIKAMTNAYVKELVSLENLISIESIFSGIKPGDLSERQINTNIKLSSLLVRGSLFDTKFSLESFDGYKYGISLEGIKDTIRKGWEKLKAFFKRIKDKISEFIEKNFSVLGIIEKQIRKNLKEWKNIGDLDEQPFNEEQMIYMRIPNSESTLATGDKPQKVASFIQHVNEYINDAVISSSDFSTECNKMLKKFANGGDLKYEEFEKLCYGFLKSMKETLEKSEAYEEEKKDKIELSGKFFLPGLVFLGVTYNFDSLKLPFGSQSEDMMDFKIKGGSHLISVVSGRLPRDEWIDLAVTKVLDKIPCGFNAMDVKETYEIMIDVIEKNRDFTKKMKNLISEIRLTEDLANKSFSATMKDSEEDVKKAEKMFEKDKLVDSIQKEVDYINLAMGGNTDIEKTRLFNIVSMTRNMTTLYYAFMELGFRFYNYIMVEFRHLLNIMSRAYEVSLRKKARRDEEEKEAKSVPLLENKS